ncbi:MAG: GNAT family acetyltransferase [Rhodoferax sp.]|nr:GNAT family acetyltransferase [Rhodoferax sp.]
MLIRAYTDADQSAVVALWQTCGLTRPWNDPVKDIARKLEVRPEWFLVGVETASGPPAVVASAMFGYDGHRGWVNYLAVRPDRQSGGLGAALMAHGEGLLKAAGCPKINLLVRTGNLQVIGFYQRLGYGIDEVTSLGKRLIPDT